MFMIALVVCSVNIFISAKQTEWMAEILFLFEVCLCVCLVRSGPAINSSTRVKATDFKFDVHVPRDSPDMTP